LAGTYGSSFPELQVCLRLVEVPGGVVAGSDVCVDPPAGPFSVSSSTFTLPASAHTYTLEVTGESNLLLTGARLVGEWNEAIVMGPGPFPVGGYVRLVDGSGGESPITRTSVAASLMLLGAGGLWVAKMRREA
jgi:hypothetical protein